MKPRKELFGVLLTPGPNGVAAGTFVRVYPTPTEIKELVCPQQFTFAWADEEINVSAKLSVTAIYNDEADKNLCKRVRFANLGFLGNVLLLGRDCESKYRSLNTLEILAIEKFCSSITAEPANPKNLKGKIMANKETDILAVKLVPGPNGAPLGKVLRVDNIREAIEKNVSSYMRDVTSRLVDVAFDLPVNAVFSTQAADRCIQFANVTFKGPVMLFGEDDDGRVCSLSRAEIHAIAYFCASFRYSEE